MGAAFDFGGSGDWVRDFGCEWPFPEVVGMASGFGASVLVEEPHCCEPTAVEVVDETAVVAESLRFASGPKLNPDGVNPDPNAGVVGVAVCAAPKPPEPKAGTAGLESDNAGLIFAAAEPKLKGEGTAVPPKLNAGAAGPNGAFTFVAGGVG